MSNLPKQSRKLSVVMIVRDAEDCLAATLDSVRNLADEIVVLDTGSQDSSILIARQKATVVLNAPWYDDFSAARNAVLASATGDWVLWLDAGETTTPETAEELRKFVDQEADEKTAYHLIVRTPTQGANVAGEQVARIRLHANLPGLAFEGRVRESLAISLAQRQVAICGLKFLLQRGTREHDETVRRRRAERNLRLARRCIEEQLPTPDLLNCLGEASQALGDNAASASFYRQALETSEFGRTEMLEAFYGLLTSLEGEENGREAQLQLCMKALEVFPLDAQLLCALGGYLQSKELLELASRAYQLSAEHGQLNLEIWHLEGLQEIAWNCLALTLQLLGREEEATQLLERELSANPSLSRLRRQLLEIHVQLGRRDEALAVVNNMPRTVPNRESLRNAVRGASLAAVGNLLSARTYLETAYKSGCREPLCLRWLADVHIKAGSLEEAGKILEQWSRVDPLNPELRQARLNLNQTACSAAKRDLRVDGASDRPRIPAPALSSLPIQMRFNVEQ